RESPGRPENRPSAWLGPQTEREGSRRSGKCRSGEARTAGDWAPPRPAEERRGAASHRLAARLVWAAPARRRSAPGFSCRSLRLLFPPKTAACEAALRGPGL